MIKKRTTKNSRKRRRKKLAVLALCQMITDGYRRKLALLPLARLAKARKAYAARCNKITQRRNKKPQPAPFLIGGAG